MDAVSGGMQAKGAWKKGVKSDAFNALVEAKTRFIVPMVVVFVTFYLGLSILSGFAKGFMAIKVYGPINMGFALVAANYIMAWVLAIVYARVSGNNHDPLVQTVINNAAMDRSRS